MSLILTRRCGERIMINENIVITLIYSDDHTVTLGIDAPKEIPVFREEVYRRMQKKTAKETRQKIFGPFERVRPLQPVLSIGQSRKSS